MAEIRLKDIVNNPRGSARTIGVSVACGGGVEISQLGRWKSPNITVNIQGASSELPIGLTNSTKIGTTYNVTGDTVLPAAGDILLTNQKYLQDGRNLLPCDGRLIDFSFPELVTAIGAIQEVPREPVALTEKRGFTQSFGGTKSSSGYGTIEFTGDDTYLSTEDYSTSNYTSVFTDDVNGNFWLEVELISWANTAHLNRFGVFFGQVPTFSNASVPHYNYDKLVGICSTGNGSDILANDKRGLAIGVWDDVRPEPGDVMAFVCDIERNGVALFHNGVQAGGWIPWNQLNNGSMLRVAVGQNASGSSDRSRTDWRIRYNTSKLGINYFEAVDGVKRVPDYTALGLPRAEEMQYKIVAQNPGSPGIAGYEG